MIDGSTGRALAAFAVSFALHGVAYVSFGALPAHVDEAHSLDVLDAIILEDTPDAPTPAASMSEPSAPLTPTRTERAIPKPLPQAPRATERVQGAQVPLAVAGQPALAGPPEHPASPNLPPQAASPPPSPVATAGRARGPRAPGGMGGLLRQYFPPRARVEGISGTVVVRLRIGTDGQASDLRVLSEAPAGFRFAEGCRAMLEHAPPFSPALDGEGRSVAATVSFTCTFQFAP